MVYSCKPLGTAYHPCCPRVAALPAPHPLTPPHQLPHPPHSTNTKHLHPPHLQRLKMLSVDSTTWPYSSVFWLATCRLLSFLASCTIVSPSYDSSSFLSRATTLLRLRISSVLFLMYTCRWCAVPKALVRCWTSVGCHIDCRMCGLLWVAGGHMVVSSVHLPAAVSIRLLVHTSKTKNPCPDQHHPGWCNHFYAPHTCSSALIFSARSLHFF